MIWMNKMRWMVIFVLTLVFAGQYSQIVTAQNAENRNVSDPDTVGDALLPTGQTIAPAGEWLSFHGRPVDLCLSADGKYLFAKDRDSLRVISVADWVVVQTIASPEGASSWGLEFSAKRNEVYFSNSAAGIHVFGFDAPTGKFQKTRTLEMPPDSYPCGICLADDEQQLFVCLSKKNCVAIWDFDAQEIVETIDVGVAPFDLKRFGDRLLVSNIGGRRANREDLTAPSAGTETVVDQRGIASTGTVSVIDLDSRQVSQQLNVGLHPSVIEVNSSLPGPMVCNTNDDSVSLLDLESGNSQAMVVKPDARLAFGSMPSAIRYAESVDRLFVALAGNNAVAVFRSGQPLPQLQGLVPTAWYPVALEIDNRYLYVACVKGIGSRAEKRPAEKGRNSHDHLGTVQRIELEQLLDEEQLKNWTATAEGKSRIKQIVANTAVPADEVERSGVAPQPIPDRLTEPSVFKHVIYVIKENRTFDQVFGDVKEARSEPSLCIFPEKITPNHHALAQRFGLLDNYYCNGILSADGHSWATEGNVTPYLERSFGGFARSYTFGDDPITYSSSGFLWDHVLAAGLTFRNYGEMDYATPPDGMKYQEIWTAYQNKQPIKFEQNIGIERLRRYSSRNYPGWNMVIPDVLRMDRFLAEFREFEKSGDLPNLTIIYLPQDHLGGGVTSEAHMADNDLAVGRLVEAVSQSRFWKDSVIFVNEDDPQNGYDHIDGHRSLCLVISPYSRPGINHDFFNQTSVIRTMLHIFGLPPMNQKDAAMPLMKSCFQDQPDLSAYQAIVPETPLNETPQPKSKQSAVERKWRQILATVPIERTGMKTEQDEDNLNRFVWHEVKGWTTPYPDQWSGAHGKGLRPLGLDFDPDAKAE
jgi:DNA-binding beta-propeller fold protein YncE/phospholipase C